MPGKKGQVDGVSHQCLNYLILWRMQKTSLAPAAPHHGALWLEEEVEAVGPPWWLPHQGNT